MEDAGQPEPEGPRTLSLPKAPPALAFQTRSRNAKRARDDFEEEEWEEEEAQQQLEEQVLDAQEGILQGADSPLARLVAEAEEHELERRGYVWR
jgi:uncharacterized membrane protein YqiK